MIDLSVSRCVCIQWEIGENLFLPLSSHDHVFLTYQAPIYLTDGLETSKCTAPRLPGEEITTRPTLTDRLSGPRKHQFAGFVLSNMLSRRPHRLSHCCGILRFVEGD